MLGKSLGKRLEKRTDAERRHEPNHKHPEMETERDIATAVKFSMCRETGKRNQDLDGRKLRRRKTQRESVMRQSEEQVIT